MRLTDVREAHFPFNFYASVKTEQKAIVLID